MGTFRLIKRVEIRIRRRVKPEESQLFEQFCTNLNKLTDDLVCVYEATDGEDLANSVRLLRMASRALEVPVTIKSNANSLIFSVRQTRKKTA